MGRTAWISGYGLALWMGVMGAHAAAGQIAAAPAVRVVIQDGAGVPAGSLERARVEATEIFRLAGISVDWIDAETCERRCLIMNITAKPVGTKSRNRAVVGVTPGARGARGIIAYAFYDRISIFSAELGLDVAKMLGHVMVHELGHLLLPHGAHSLAGVMRPAWDRTQAKRALEGTMTFTPDQAELIRTRLSASVSPIQRVQ
jgi:hypothetical protein